MVRKAAKMVVFFINTKPKTLVMKYYETLQRLNALLHHFKQNSELTLDQLMRIQSIPRSTLIRDIQRLQNLGHEIHFCRKKRSYRLEY